MVRWPETRKPPPLAAVLLTLAPAQGAVLTWKSSAPIWCELHERVSAAGRRAAVIVLDNLKEGVLTPTYDPALNPLYRDAAHYGVVALPCRGRSRSEGQVESGHRPHATDAAQGLRFETRSRRLKPI